MSLQDYSTAYKVSTSTLRRRIKTGEVEFRMKDGKYFIKNDKVLATPSLSGHTFVEKQPPVLVDKPITPAEVSVQDKDKDNEILNLKKEVADLKTLVQILESELKREKFGFGNAPIDEWIDNKEFLVKKEK